MYRLRKNFNVEYEDDDQFILGKGAFKTTKVEWDQTYESVICLISVNSAIHKGIEGDLKMNGMMSVIKNHVKGKATVLIADTAHLHALMRKEARTSEECHKEAVELVSRYHSYFQGCELLLWSTFLSTNIWFHPFQNALHILISAMKNSNNV